MVSATPPLTVMLLAVGVGVLEAGRRARCVGATRGAFEVVGTGRVVGGLGVVVLGAAVTTPAGATADGSACPCALARRLSATTTAVVTVMTAVTRRLIGVTT
jgi:hypothetical protein